MSERKPFWSSVPGVATGVAGVVSAIVGLLGVSVQLGWIGGGDNKDTSAATSTLPDGSTGSTASTVRGASTVPPTVRTGQFVVDPTSVSFEPLAPREATVTVSNTGDAPLTVRSPTITGSGAEHFQATDVSCDSTLPADDSCEIKVTFAPKRAGQYTAVLLITASNGARQVEVALKGNAPLG